jgi:hypothetical protein
MFPQTYIISNVIFIFMSFAKDTVVATGGDSQDQQQQQQQLTPFLINLFLHLLEKNVSCCFFFLCL